MMVIPIHELSSTTGMGKDYLQMLVKHYFEHRNPVKRESVLVDGR